VRLVVLVALIVAVALAPLFVVYRSRGCSDEGGRETRWSFVAPFSDPPEECSESDNGFQVLREEVGLE
jgi:hypothetical protein